MFSPKLGRLPARHDRRTLKLSSYTAKLATAPPYCDRTAKSSHLGMMLNDQLGDCTIAAAAHLVQLWTADAGHQVIVSDADVLRMYEGATGYIPSDPSTDQGGVELDVLQYWRQHGIGQAGHKIAAYVVLDPTNVEEIKQAVYYFGGAYIGLNLPEAATSNYVWDMTTGQIAGGHAVPIVAYDEAGVTVISWGMLIKASWAFLPAWMEEAYAVLSPDMFTVAGKSPAGFDLAQLQTDLKEVAA